MNPRTPRVILIIGVVAMLAGALDPLEGSLVILPAITMVAVGAGMGHSPHRHLTYIGLALATIGIAALWGWSAAGGFGGRSMWWGLTLLPYPIGWTTALIGGIRAWRDGMPGAHVIRA